MGEPDSSFEPFYRLAALDFKESPFLIFLLLGLKRSQEIYCFTNVAMEIIFKIK